MFSSEATVFLSSYCVLGMYTRLWWVEDRYAIGRLPPRKTPIGKKVASPLKTHWGKLVGGIFQCPLAELGVLPSPVFAVYLRMTLTYPQDAQLEFNKKVWFVHWINDQRGWVGNVIWNCPGGISRGREVLEDLGDVRGSLNVRIPSRNG